jgi:argonaute-like protein implicated in RNA metabolism and viral defense
MTQLSTKIKLYANKEVDFKTEVKLQDDGNGAYIKEWNLDIPKPTMAQLDTFESQAEVYERNQQVINTRKSLYGSWEKQLEEINENGIDSWKARIANIKLNNPKE